MSDTERKIREHMLAIRDVLAESGNRYLSMRIKIQDDEDMISFFGDLLKDNGINHYEYFRKEGDNGTVDHIQEA